MIWRKIKKVLLRMLINVKHLRSKTVCSEWIENILKVEKITYKNYQNIEIHRINVKKLGFKNLPH